MAQQPATIKRSGTSAILAMVSRKPEPEVELRSIPLVLRPLLEPYKGQDKVMLRVERLPQRARLSAGQNNGDQSWSLAPDELDNLVYLLPADITEVHNLQIRVISRVDGSTVAVLSYRVSPADAVAHVPAPTGPRAVAGLSELAALRDELAQAKATLSQSEGASEERFQQAEQDWAERSRALVENTLTKAKAEWDAEFSARLKAVADRAEQTLQSRRQAWEDELKAGAADAERRAEEAKTLARENWKRDTEAALAQARESWKSGEATRLAAAEAQWREQARSAETVVRSQAEKSQRDGAELAQLREQLSAARQLSDERERALASAKQEVAGVRESVVREQDTALARARLSWASEESTRQAEAEARLRSESQAALADATARRERAEKALGEAVRQIEFLSTRRDEGPRPESEEVTNLRATLASAHAALSQQREQGLKDLEAKLAEARIRWKGEEDARVAAAEQRLRAEAVQALGLSAAERERSEKALADVREQTLLAQSEEKRRLELETKVRTLEASLSGRDAEIGAAKDQARQSAEQALSVARQEWAAGEAVRLKDAQARIRAESEKALEEAARGRELAEQQLADAKAQAANSRERIEILRLRDELEKMRITVEVRDVELRQARSRALPSLELGEVQQPVLTPLKRNRMATREDPAKKAEQRRKARSLVRDIVLIVLVIFLIALVPLSRPYVEPLLPYSWQDELDSTFGDLYVAQPAAAPVKPQAAAAPAPVAASQPATETVIKAANLHSAPSKSAAVVASLPAGAKVVPLDEQGNWVHVSVGTTDTGQDGWVYSSYLGSDASGAGH